MQQPAISIIESESVHRIVAGQAILDLPSAVKELLDNALDAGAKSINIRLFNQGIDIVEVSDDGCGIPLHSRHLVAYPHATSKITSFQDIYSSNVNNSSSSSSSNAPSPSSTCDSAAGYYNTTLGFRGEALFCLANLSRKLIVATRVATEPMAQKLEFDRAGNLACIPSPMHRKVGTTVAVVGLLEALPVRHADFVRQIPLQRRKVLQLVQTYAVFCIGVRIHLMDMVAGGVQESTLLSSSLTNTTLAESISDVVSSSFLHTLCEINLDLSDAVMNNDNGVSNGSNAQESSKQHVARIEGYVSHARGGDKQLSQGGSSNSSKNRRSGNFYCINRRPVDLPKVTRILNDLWRQIVGDGSRTAVKKPSCVLHFTLPGYAYDINLSPDKRQVQFTNEVQILNLLRTAVSELWSSQLDGQFTASTALSNLTPSKIQQTRTYSQLASDSSDDDCSDNDSPGRFNRRYAFSHDFKKAKLQHEYDDGRRRRISCEDNNNNNSIDNQEYTRQTTTDVYENAAEESEAVAPVTDNNTSSDSQMSSSEAITKDDTDTDVNTGTNIETSKHIDHQTSTNRRDNMSLSPKSTIVNEEVGVLSNQHSPVVNPYRPCRSNEKSREDASQTSATILSTPSSMKQLGLQRFGFNADNKSTPVLQTPGLTTDLEEEKINNGENKLISSDSVEGLPRNDTTSTDKECSRHLKNTSDSTELSSPMRTTTDANVNTNISGSSSMEEPVEWSTFSSTNAVIAASRQAALDLRRRTKQMKENILPSSSSSSTPQVVDLQSDTKTHQVGNAISIDKTSFADMKIIGQYNLGFILAASKDGNIWILDQHACDERYNFEKLCADTVISEQPLIQPMPLDLSVSEEMCISDNIDIFAKNGFRFKYDAGKPPRHRYSLVAVPHSGARNGSKAVQFNKDDISNLCAILSNDDDDTNNVASGGTGTDGSGVYGNNAVRRYAGRSGDNAEKVLARLPKAVAMFASRACRNSVMIGTALSSREMGKIVGQLKDLSQPWNCAHGRPTLHHVAQIKELVASDINDEAEYVSGPTMAFLTQDV